uniref:G_PROTEIN_RECEP_F1_2 domain-containing protein n=1 Tax=Meloidogyne hapla TaxID=6305 RepID=A0A1I8B895_MELHA
MIKYVNSHVGFDQTMKRLLKQLTKTLIILAFIPFINQTIVLIVMIFAYKQTSGSEDNNTNIRLFFFCCFFHFTPVFNPLVCILTTKPYREAVFNRLRIHPQ